jgi:serine/threonine protein kinase
MMETKERWQHVGRKAKSFIRGCCVPNESQRLTAKQALLHEWFTNKYYAQELEAAYQRAINDWMPRAETDDVVEFIDTGVAAAGTGLFAGDTTSPHFLSPPPQTQMQNESPSFSNMNSKCKVQPAEILSRYGGILGLKHILPRPVDAPARASAILEYSNVVDGIGSDSHIDPSLFDLPPPPSTQCDFRRKT